MSANWSALCRNCGEWIRQGESSTYYGYEWGTWYHEDTGRLHCNVIPEVIPVAEPTDDFI